MVYFCVYSVKMMYLIAGGVAPPVVLLVENSSFLINILLVSDPFLFCKWKNVLYSFLWPSESVKCKLDI